MSLLWYDHFSLIQAIWESFLRSSLILQYYFFHFLIFSFLPHSTDSRMILPSFLSFVCHYWLSKLIHHQILGAWALGSFCQKAWTRSLSSLDWLLAYWMRLDECRMRWNEIGWVLFSFWRKREVSPAPVLCRGRCLDWLLAYWMRLNECKMR